LRGCNWSRGPFDDYYDHKGEFDAEIERQLADYKQRRDQSLDSPGRRRLRALESSIVNHARRAHKNILGILDNISKPNTLRRAKRTALRKLS